MAITQIQKDKEKLLDRIAGLIYDYERTHNISIGNTEVEIKFNTQSTDADIWIYSGDLTWIQYIIQ